MLLFVPAWVGAADAPKKDKEDPVVWGEMPAGAKTAYIGIHGGTVPVSLLSAGDGSPMIAMVGLTGNDFLNFMRNNGKLREEPVLPEFPAPQFSPEPVLPALLPTSRADTVATQAPPLSSPTPDPCAPPVAAPAAPPESPAASVATATPPTNLAPPTVSPEPASLPAASTAPLASEAQPTELAATVVPAPAPGVNATLLLAGTSGGDIPVIYATGRAFERMSLIPENWAPFGLTEKALSLEGEVKILAAPKKMPRRKAGRK
ncbi:MAG: hypothetical protein RRY20_02895 [Bilophila sp.]